MSGCARRSSSRSTPSTRTPGSTRERYSAFHRHLFDENHKFGEELLKAGLILPALEHCLKCSHLFNLLDSSGSVGVTERMAYILRVRQLALAICKAYVDRRIGNREPGAGSRQPMDRELLLEIGTEEIPASWLPGLTTQLGTVLEAKLKEARLSTDEPIETYSTPRRLTVRSARISERQTDLEELVTGPPVSAAFDADGKLTPAGAGFVKKQNATEDQIERVTTPKGEYIGVRKHQRGKAAVDVLPEVLNNVLRGMSFPKQMRWDAMLNDGKGELPFGRPIRWILYLYGGRVVPFTIARSPLAAGSRVQEISTGASTYGHRFLTTSGRAGRAVKVKHFDDYRKRLAEHFVVLERSERHERIARELDAEARRRGGRIARSLVGQGMLDEVPDLVEYPVVASGAFPDEFLQASRGSADDDDDSSSAFLSGDERSRKAPAGVSRRAQHGARPARRSSRATWSAC